MNKVSVNSLLGKHLDYAVGTLLSITYLSELRGKGIEFAPSSDWELAGDILGRSNLRWRVQPVLNARDAVSGQWHVVFSNQSCGDGPGMPGPTLAVATMRAFVAFYVGNKINIPSELYLNPEFTIRKPFHLRFWSRFYSRFKVTTRSFA